MMDYSRLLADLADLGAELVAENEFVGDTLRRVHRIDIPTGEREAVVISGDGQRAYLVSVMRWDRTGALTGDREVLDTDDAAEAVTAARGAVADLARAAEAEDAMWAELDRERAGVQTGTDGQPIVIPPGASRVGTVTLRPGRGLGVVWNNEK